MFQGIKLLESIEVQGISIALSNSQSKNYKAIRDLWQSFNKELYAKQIKLGKNWKKYGIITKSGNTYFYLAAISSLSTYNDFEKIKLKGGAYACFRHVGAMYQLKDFYYQLYKKVIPGMDLTIDKNRDLIHYELYTCKFNWNQNNSIIDIFVPLGE